MFSTYVNVILSKVPLSSLVGFYDHRDRLGLGDGNQPRRICELTGLDSAEDGLEVLGHGHGVDSWVGGGSRRDSCGLLRCGHHTRGRGDPGSNF